MSTEHKFGEWVSRRWSIFLLSTSVLDASVPFLWSVFRYREWTCMETGKIGLFFFSITWIMDFPYFMLKISFVFYIRTVFLLICKFWHGSRARTSVVTCVSKCYNVFVDFMGSGFSQKDGVSVPSNKMSYLFFVIGI